MKRSRLLFLALSSIAVIPATTFAAPVVRSSTGAAAADITAARDQFRTDIGGGTTAGANGSFSGLRREINWDGVGAAFDDPNNLPANFFNVNSPRGAVFSTPGTGFRTSSATTDAGAGQPAAAAFGSINAGYTTAFAPFSAQRLFTALGSNITDVNFFVPGTATPATVAGFGAVFSDVDDANSTRLEYYNAANQLIHTQNVLATAGNATFSFAGVSFNAGEQIGRVRIFSGNSALGAGVSDGAGTDVAVMDDFIFSEPVPEPASLGLVGASGLLLMRKRRK